MTDFMEATDPLELFSQWFGEARQSEPRDANAMIIASVDARGMPNLRAVLLKEVISDRFLFNTNMESAKAQELLAHPETALLFYWKSQNRQIRLRGFSHPLAPAEADRCFAARPRESQIGAWASQQSRPMGTRDDLRNAMADQTEKLGDLPHIPRPPHWSGFAIQPIEIEFWEDRPFRLHDRALFVRENIHKPWARQWLFP